MSRNAVDFHAVSSVFGTDDTAFINGLADEFLEAGLFESRFENFIPHITYAALNFTDNEGVTKGITAITANIAPFVLHTTGLGIFTGALPVIYIHIVRTPQLNRLQHEIAEILAPFATERHPHFDPSVWLPHLTIGWPKGPQELGKAVELLSQRSLNREIAIDNITILYNDNIQSPQRFDLKG